MRVFIEIKSAGAKFNINNLADKKIREAFINYLARYNVGDAEYLVALLVDNMQKERQTYESDIFDEKMWLYRDKIASSEHLKEILDFYVKNRHDPYVYDVPWDKIVRFADKDSNGTSLDANYFTAEMWQMMIPLLDEVQVEELSDHLAVFQKFEDTGLQKEDYKIAKEVYKAGFYYPVLEVSVDIEDKNSSAKIKFDYDIKAKKGKNFEFHI